MGIVVLTNTDRLYFLSADNSIFVGDNATLFSTTTFDTPLIESFASGRTVQVEGTLLSQTANAVILSADDLGTGDHTVVVGESGAAYANRNYVTLVVDGTGSLVQNFGLISGGGGVWGFGWGNSRLENEGSIAAQRFAAVKLFDTVGVNAIVNGGEITGAGGVVFDNATATIVNEAGGEIRSNTAAVAAVDGSIGTGVVLRNAGTVTGIDDAVIASGLADRVVNTGTIDGDVLLGNGNDVYRGKSGTLVGELRGGSGNDTLIGGLGDDTIFGEIGNDRIGGSAGDNLLSGGAGADVFFFSRGGGDDVVTDFADNSDDLDLTAFRFASFTAVTGRATNVAGGLLLDFETIGGGTVFLQGMTKAMLDAGDVLL